MRGSVSAWETLLTTPERVSDDTLYFIYESTNNPTEGKLYLGQKLISGTGSGGGSSVVNINDLSDIYIDNESLADKQILVYNETYERWENTSLSAIINDATSDFHGASAVAAGTHGLVPAPAAGDQNKFLRGDGTWQPVNIPSFDSNIFTINNSEVTLNGFQGAAVGAVPVKTNNGIRWSDMPTGTLNRQITTLEKLRAQLAGTDPDPLDTNTIYMVLNGNGSESSDRYSEYMVIGDSLELLGTFGQVDLTNYITTTTFNTAISSLEDVLQDTVDPQTGNTNLGLVSRVAIIENNYVTHSQIGDLSALILSDGNSNLVEEVNAISDRLQWHELTQ